MVEYVPDPLYKKIKELSPYESTTSKVRTTLAIHMLSSFALKLETRDCELTRTLNP